MKTIRLWLGAMLAVGAVSLYSGAAHAAAACGILTAAELDKCKVFNKQTECTQQCEPVNMTRVCTTKCSGGCNKSATTTCKGGCETECTEQLKGACNTKCTTTEGALFCDGQFIDTGSTIKDCVTEIEGQGTVVVDKGGDAICSSSRTASTYLAMVLAGLATAGLLIRRRLFGWVR
jgi:hypothetical protein